ncbi:MAG: hypothetical protein U9O98_09890 [Asgard group archaeon]|nr:hypothetical protein [Asgard group archaeon]
MTTNAWEAPTIINWILPAIGIVVSLILLFYLWRYIRYSNEAGRLSEFDERTFKQLVKKGSEKEIQAVCPECHIPMRVEIRYKDHLKDSGDFLITTKSLEETLHSLVECYRITEIDARRIKQFFKDHPGKEQQLFKRYRCPNCEKTVVLPYHEKVTSKEEKE